MKKDDDLPSRSQLAAHTRRTEGGQEYTEYTTADGRYRLWPIHFAWRRGWRWAIADWRDHDRGCFHGAAPTLREALRATERHRREYGDE